MGGESDVLGRDAVLGAYRIVRHLGGGGMGHVYEAEHIALGVHRAVKVFGWKTGDLAALQRRFMVEGRTLANLDHPKIVRVYDLAVDEATGATYFAMDLVLSPDGTPRTLEDERRAGVDEERIAAWFSDVCEGLDYVHSKGIVHCDIKLENILVGADGRAVVSDFGISRIFDEGLRTRVAAGESLAEDGGAFLMGTPRYRAPELNSASPALAGPETDAWALGVCIFRLLAGLWLEEDRQAQCLEMLEGYEMPWREVVARLCAANPADRPSAGRLVALSERIAGHRSRRHRRIVACAAACAVALILLGGAIYFRAASRDTAEVRLCPESPTWSEFHRRFDDASNAILVAPFDGMDGEVEEVMRQFIARQASFYCYDVFWPRECLERIDALVSWHLHGSGMARRASSPQLLVLAAETYRQKKLLEYDLGEYPADVERIAVLANMVASDVSAGLFDAEWAFDIMEATLPFDRLEGRSVIPGDIDSQRSADPWLAKMLQAATLAAEAARAHDSSVSDKDEREHDGKCLRAARLFKEALVMRPERYRAAERLIALAHDDADEARAAFERCQRFCFDDLRAWKAYANTILDLEDPRRERLAALLDRALATGRYDTWTPAFYVIGRWSLIGRYDREGWTLDDRSRAFTDENVRRNVIAVIRRYLDGDAMLAAPKPRRLAVTAIFAASALACGDDALARDLVRRIPADEINAVLGMAMRTSSPSFRILKNMVK